MISNELFLAILSMDVYNRTAPQGGSVGLFVPGDAIGGATVLTGPGGAMADPTSGFFAQAYSLSGGQKVIA
jgi:hypothetical protein